MEEPHILKTMSDGLTERVLSDDPFFSEDAFSRSDESDDTIFYATDRFVQHLDSLADTHLNQYLEYAKHH